ncbi:MarR family transcriptional regulator [Thioclava sp. GXIMD4216]|uniref:MarR family transcriptional regulator n=1 Tax=Thioclava litoralis TaxID=3076557 RepID=A0ABZ1DYQ4_9RHOB|nr:MarR family transcriptional regulator [Thioclava sp. FTW29]
MTRLDDRMVLNSMVFLNRRLRKAFDARASALGLTFARAQALLQIARNEGSSQTELAEALRIETPTLNRTLDSLEQTGFIERRAVEGDRRVRRVFLTDLSKDKAADILQYTNTLRHDLFHNLSDEEFAQLYELVQRLHVNLDDMAKNV